MYYTDILLFQGAEPDGISDATSRLLAVLHGINRGHGNAEAPGGYPLAIAFPRWQAPTISANRPLSNGTTGPILRVFGPEALLTMLNSHKLMHSLTLEGRADPGKIIKTPENANSWVAYRRYHHKEKTMSASYQKRHQAYLDAKRNSAEADAPVSDPPKPKNQHLSYIYLKIPRATHVVTFPVVEKSTSTHLPEQALRINSWGLTTGGWLPYF